jgi:hypothetical protein
MLENKFPDFKIGDTVNFISQGENGTMGQLKSLLGAADGVHIISSVRPFYRKNSYGTAVTLHREGLNGMQGGGLMGFLGSLL